MTEMPPDVPQPSASEPETLVAEPASPSRRGLVIGVGAAVLAVVAGAAIYATSALSGGGRQPDELMPKTTFAFAKVDLDPAAGQKLSARAFLNKFPKAKTNEEEDNVFESLLREAISDEDLDYTKDVKPWFDRRAAIGAFPGVGGSKVVVVLRSKDDGKARTALDAVLARTPQADRPFAYTIAKGYVVMGEKQSDVEEAVSQSDKESLHDNETYRADVDRLTGDQVAVAWVDAKEALDTIEDMLPLGNLLSGSLEEEIDGRFVTGLHFTRDYLEVEGLFVGAKPRKAKLGDAELLRKLPAGTVAAVSIQGLSDTLGKMVEQMAADGFDAQDALDAYLGPAGPLSIANDLLPLFRAETVISVAGESFENPKAGIQSTVTDAARARATGEKLAAVISTLAGLPVRSDVSGTTFSLATENYLGALKSGSGLGDLARFKKVMGELGADTEAAIYVDLEPFIKADPEAADVAALRAAGLVGSVRDGVGYFRFRLLAE